MTRFERHRSGGKICAAVLASTLAASGLGALAIAPAANASALWDYSFDTPGAYSFTIPSVASEVLLSINGASGGDGGANSFGRGGFGQGGVGIGADLPVGSGVEFHPGETITIVVGKRGTGGAGGSGNEVGQNGGAGGGASAIISDTGTIVVAAGGGGGGGGAGGAGGDGGAGNGNPGANLLLGTGGAGGTGGDALTCGPNNVAGYFGSGLPGDNAASFSDSGGGGGGGGGACGAGGGHAGTGGAAGGGGGLGGSIYNHNWLLDGLPGPTNAGLEGNVDLIFTVNANQTGVTFTSPASATVSSDQVYFSQQVSALAPPNTTISYALSDAPSWLSIDPSTGVLTALGFRGAGALGVVNFHVLAKATTPDSATPLTYVQNFALTINQLPQFAPVQPLTETAGSTFTTPVTATSYPAPAYSLNGAGPSWLSIDAATGVLTGRPPVGSQGSYAFGVVARNGVDPIAVRMVYLTIAVAPLKITTAGLGDATVGHAYSQTLQSTGGSGGAVTWSIAGGALPPGLALSSAGVISGTDTGPIATMSSFVVQAADDGSPQQVVTRPLTIVTSPTALAVNVPAMVNTFVGAAYTQQLQATGGYPLYQWSLAPGSVLPAGLTLSSTGVLSGRPTSAGSSAVDVVVSDILLTTASAHLTINVAPALVATGPSSLQATLGANYQSQLTASGGSGAYHWAVNAGSVLPAGLTLSSAGVLSGFPTKAGTNSVVLVLTDSAVPTPQRVIKPYAITVPSRPVPDLGVTISAASVFKSGKFGAWTITAVNHGSAASAAMTLTLRLPAGVMRASVSGSGWTCTASAGTLTCTHAAVAAHAAVSPLRVTVAVTAQVGATLTATATLSPGDVNAANNTSTSKVVVQHA